MISVYLISFIIITFYYSFFYLKIVFYRKNKSTELEKNNCISKFNSKIDDFGLSIIICAKNELENLKQNLPKILSQSKLTTIINEQSITFKYEIIVVNDQSHDGSIHFLEEMEKKYDFLKIVNINQSINHSEGKKFALTLGIKTAKYKYLLMTDADCSPNSNKWSNIMFNCFFSNNNDFDVILGYSPYKKQKGILNKLIRFDTFTVAQQYLSYALSNLTYMGVGRNLAYKKELFFNNKGFASHIHIPSGDDDLFIQEITANKDIKVGIEFSKDAQLVSEAKSSWKDWTFQKRRHVTTSSFYKKKFKILLSIYPLSQICFLVSLIFSIFLKINPTLIYSVLFVKLFISYLINYKSMRKLNVRDLYWLHPMFELINLFVQANFVFLNLFRKPRKWSR